MIPENFLPEMNMDIHETNCCPRFDSAPWHEKVISLEGLKFVKVHTRSLFYMPLNMKQVMQKTMKAVEQANATSIDRYLMLSLDLSKWECAHYILVEKEVPAMEMADLKGHYYTESFEGEFRELPNWMKVFKGHAREKGYSVNEVYAFYTTCPKCAKHYGKNDVVLFGKVNI